MERQSVTAFRRKVYNALLGVPRGEVITYGELARRIGCGSPRAVGQALRLNPFAPRVPCHRVVAAGGDLGGFFGRRDAAAFARKRALLEAEGVRFDAAGRVEGMAPPRPLERKRAAFRGKEEPQRAASGGGKGQHMNVENSPRLRRPVDGPGKRPPAPEGRAACAVPPAAAPVPDASSVRRQCAKTFGGRPW